MKGQDFGALVLLAALWGGSFLLIRITAPALGPLVVAEARVLIAGGALLLYAAALRRLPSWRAHWRNFLIMGLLNNAIPFTLIGAAELHLTASLAAILNATTPLFAAVVAALWLRDRLTARKGLGILVGLAGVAVLVGWSPLPLSPVVLISAGASLLAALSYALAGVYARRALAGLPTLTLAIGQQLGAGLLLLPLALPALAVAPAGPRLTAGVEWALLALALLCSSLAYLLYFHLIASVGPTATLSVTFLVPVFGLLWSALFLHEALRAGTFAGLGIILASIVLVTGRRGRVPTAASLPARANLHAK